MSKIYSVIKPPSSIDQKIEIPEGIEENGVIAQ